MKSIIFFYGFLANGLNDVTCDASSEMNLDTRARTDLHIFVETTWQFNEIQPAIAYVSFINQLVLAFHSQIKSGAVCLS